MENFTMKTAIQINDHQQSPCQSNSHQTSTERTMHYNTQINKIMSRCPHKSNYRSKQFF